MAVRSAADRCCRTVRADCRALGYGLARLYGMTNTKMLTKIGNLLRQAEGTDNDAEAEAFTAAAQRLATAHSVSLEWARLTADSRHRSATPINRRYVLGEAGKRGLRTYVELMRAITSQNSVTIDIAHNSTYVILFGYESDIDTVESMYASQVVQMVKACEAYLARGEWKTSTITKTVRRTECFESWYETVTVTPNRLQARLEFQTGYAYALGERLAQARQQATVDLDKEATSTAETGMPTAVVLRGREAAVAAFHSKTSRARGSWRGSRSTSYGEHARDAGAKAAKDASMATATTLGHSSRSLPA